MYKSVLIILLVFANINRSFDCDALPLDLQPAAVSSLYHDCGLEKLICIEAFNNSLSGYNQYSPNKPIIAICDFTKPSTEERFFIVDLEHKKVLYKSLVAHGKNSGDLMATHFSNQPESLQSSLGFYKIGATIQSPKHGVALLLHGLEKAKNDNALKRQIIMHGADYVCQKFVSQYGRLGRSFGCPALPNSLMKEVAPILQNGALLYIYAG